MALTLMAATNTPGRRIRLSQRTLQRLSRVLLVLLLFNVAAFAAQACAVASTSSASVDFTAPPCDGDDEGCLAETFGNDGTLRSRPAVYAQSVPPTEPLGIPVTSEQPRLPLRAAWPVLEPPAPLRLQICRLLF